MTALVSLLVFSLDTLRLGLPVESAVRVLPACEVTPLPDAPAQVLGAINLHGVALPVLDLRPRLRLAPRALRADDRFVVVKAGGREVAVMADEADGVREFAPARITAADAEADGMAWLQGVVRLEDGLLLIEDPDRFLSLHDMQQLERALEAHGADDGT